MSTITVTLPADMGPIAGPLLLGYMFNWGLFGALAVQVYTYYTSFPRDRPLVKCVVYGVFVLELAQTIIIAHDAFLAFARGFGRLEELNSVHTEWLATPLLSGVVSCVVQIFYGYRLLVLSGSTSLFLAIALIALLQCSAAIAQGIQVYFVGNFASLAQTVFITCSIWLAGSATCDVVIAVAMTWQLFRMDSGLPSTHRLIVKLVQLVIETGALTATTATVDLVLFLGIPHKPYHSCVALTLGKLYSNSLLVMLNSRTQLAELRANAQPISLESDFGRRPPSTGPSFSLGGRDDSANAVRVQQETWVTVDEHGSAGTHSSGSLGQKKFRGLVVDP